MTHPQPRPVLGSTERPAASVRALTRPCRPRGQAHLHLLARYASRCPRIHQGSRRARRSPLFSLHPFIPTGVPLPHLIDHPLRSPCGHNGHNNNNRSLAQAQVPSSCANQSARRPTVTALSLTPLATCLPIATRRANIASRRRGTATACPVPVTLRARAQRALP